VKLLRTSHLGTYPHTSTPVVRHQSTNPLRIASDGEVRLDRHVKQNPALVDHMILRIAPLGGSRRPITNEPPFSCLQSSERVGTKTAINRLDDTSTVKRHVLYCTGWILYITNSVASNHKLLEISSMATASNTSPTMP
jgi:hypothetical protein